ncbi:malate transporter [Pokkaliibacter plantistimulans]|uniref:Malate transporter n=1 Tax=Pokkaliibacter plantistimulans TaxID=1635171 RepID=A0ABX5LVL4_9GAMM|nr:AEC family transporter [Pokkaliibacter plantistimulans]PXF30712.1 malate transporter [Pokkaliibacter plantistimulans]
MSAQVDVLSEIFTVSMPVFVMVIVGMVLKRVRLIDDAFIGTSSTLTFKALMPALLFFGIMQADLHTALQPKLIGYFYLATLLTFAVSWLWSLKAVPAAQRGVYVQGAFRGNCGIVSLALATSLYGDYGLSIGGVMAGLVIILFNVLSVIVLAIYSTSYQADLRSVLRDMARNPLILSVLAGLVASLVGLKLPAWLLVSVKYFTSMTLPLALICVGGSMSLASFIDSGRVAFSASLIKVLWSPLLFVALAWAIGFRDKDLGMLLLFLASPTAAASYVMARATGSDAKLAANIIAVSTALSIVTIMGGLFLLQHFAL